MFIDSSQLFVVPLKGEDAFSPCESRAALHRQLPEHLSLWNQWRTACQHLHRGAWWWVCFCVCFVCMAVFCLNSELFPISFQTHKDSFANRFWVKHQNLGCFVKIYFSADLKSHFPFCIFKAWILVITHGRSKCHFGISDVISWHKASGTFLNLNVNINEITVTAERKRGNL